MLRFLLLLLVMAHASAAPAQEDRPSGARPLSAAAGAGLEGVGRVDLGGGFCTGALVAPALVLTAAHCLFDASGQRIDAEAIRFRAGLRDGRAHADRRVRRAVVHPDYRHGADPTIKRIAADLALLELERGMGFTGVTPFPVSRRLSTGDRVELISYARGRSEAPAREEGCQVLTRDDWVLVLDCDVDFGASGSPVFQSGPAGRGIASVVSAVTEIDGRRVALAATVEAGLDRVMATFRGAPTFGPGVKRLRMDHEDRGTMRFLRPGQ
jgi:V8-like Glu-specific endopeptidase